MGDKRHKFHQSDRAGYCVTNSSGVSKTIPSTMAWQMSMRSKGSLCRSGSRSLFTQNLETAGETIALLVDDGDDVGSGGDVECLLVEGGGCT